MLHTNLLPDLLLMSNNTYLDNYYRKGQRPCMFVLDKCRLHSKQLGRADSRIENAQERHLRHYRNN